MNKFLHALAIALTSLALYGCASPPPPNAVPFRISVVSETRSPYWTSVINSSVPSGLNKRARYKIATPRIGAPYKLHVKIYDVDSYVTGHSFTYGGTSTHYRTKVEVEAALFDQHGKEQWSWSGWADYGSAEKSMKAIAKMMASDMYKNGKLSPPYYE